MDSGMPPDLQEFLTRRRPEDLAPAEQAWIAVGAEGQQTYRAYLDRAMTRRGRRERVAALADQLLYGALRAGLPPPISGGPYR